MKDKILEIIDQYIPDTQKGSFVNCASEIESLIKENYYPKGYLRWYRNQEEFYPAVVDDKYVWYVPNFSSNQLPEYLNDDELYNYWLKNIK